jgi:hypothetical protein
VKKQRKDLNMPTDTQHSHSNEQQQMDAVVIQASGPPAQSLAYRCEPMPYPSGGPLAGVMLTKLSPAARNFGPSHAHNQRRRVLMASDA